MHNYDKCTSVEFKSANNKCDVKRQLPLKLLNFYSGLKKRVPCRPCTNSEIRFHRKEEQRYQVAPALFVRVFFPQLTSKGHKNKARGRRVEKESHFDALRCTRAHSARPELISARQRSRFLWRCRWRKLFYNLLQCIKKDFLLCGALVCCWRCERRSHAHCAQLGGGVFRFVKYPSSLAYAPSFLSWNAGGRAAILRY